MKKQYEKPVVVIELFQDPDVIVCSSGEIPGYDDQRSKDPLDDA